MLTPRHAAELLQIRESLVVELATARQPPGRRLGADWRFSRRALLQWLESADAANSSQKP